MRSCLLVLLSPLASLSLSYATVIADSQADFSADGAQGEGGWSYGYRLVEEDADRSDYHPLDDFVEFSEDDGWTFNGAWDWGDGSRPWTQVSATGGHPNGTNTGEEHWAIRRWEVQVANAKPLAVTWHLAKANTGGGNGVTGSVHLNGVRVDSASVAGTDGVGFERTVYVNVVPGDFLDLALLPEGEDGDPIDGSDGSEFWFTVDDEIPANPTQPDGSVFVAGEAEDSDGDGLPDDWERVYFADLSILTETGDHDGDELTDFLEFKESTDPTNTDTDGDGLTDGAEVASGSNPRRIDSDGNGLTDGQELVVDEIIASKIGDSIEDFGEDQGPTWFNGYRNYTADGGGEDYDRETGFIAFDADDGWTWNGAAWDWGDGNVPWTTISSENVHPNGTNSSDEHWAIRRWVADEITEVTPLAILWNVREQNVAGGGISGSLHVNGKRVDKGTVAGGDEVGQTRLYFLNAQPGDLIDLALTPEGPSDNRSDGSDGSFSWMIVSTFIPENARQPDGELFVPATGDDSDGDGLPDAWERLYFENDLTPLATGNDNDSDGLNDEDEFLLNANPTVADTDGDGLADGAERNDGVYVDASKAGSSPLKADTDGDGLTDSMEVNGDPATDPNKPDSDGDGFTDREEIAEGFDPNDAGSNPFATLVADSVSELSGNQGENGWFFGYRDLGSTPEELPVDYDPVADFTAFNEDDGWTWNGSQWDWGDGNVPWTFLASEGAHPNGTNSGDVEHWAIRRWVADELTDTTPLAILYHLRKTNTNGNGTTVQLHLNGELLDSVAVAGNDSTGVFRTYYANVNPGDIVDVALTPVGPDEGRGDGSDGSAFWMRVDREIPDNPTQPDESIFEPFVPGNPHLSIPPRTPFGLLGDNPGRQERTVTIKNSGTTEDLTITSAILSGTDRANFTTDLTVPLTLAPGATNEFTVIFDPQGRDGGFIASLDFVSNDENEANRSLDLNASIPDANKLIAWYKMDETDGMRLDDASGNDNHGTYVSNGGSVDLAQGGLAGGSAVRFTPAGDGAAAYAEVASFPALEEGFSISMWFQADASIDPVAAGLISKNDGETGGRPYALAASGNQLLWFGDGTPDITGENSPVETGETQHVLVSYAPADSVTVSIYLDGVLTETLEGATEITDIRSALQIGAVNGAAGFSGLIDDVQIYGRVLSADDAAELFANPGDKLGGGGLVTPPSSDFRNSLTDVVKTSTGLSVSADLDAATTYNVEYSENLQVWEVIATDVTVAPFEDTDTTRTARPSGYYRVTE